MDPLRQDRDLAAIQHWVTAGAMVISAGVIGWLLPLVLFFTSQSKFVKFHALQSLIAQVGFLVVATVLAIAGPFTCFISWLLLGVVWVGLLAFHIIAGIKAKDGQVYELPVVGQMAKNMLP
ncbi:MAG: DUF4870 domain-containing protein [Armatimonadetes bacterium]|nr:DUF4870 domain-containing protein [Armatimonadota bacterium]